MIQISSLSFSYGDLVIFDHVNLTFPEKGLVVILGKSGSGKSTLLSLLSHSLKPSEGEIKGVDINSLSMVYQSPLLLSYLTVKENIAFPLILKGKKKEEYEKEVGKMISDLNLRHVENHYPNELSGGEMMRVSIARALVKGGDTLILDEPTGQLDEIHSQSIYSMLKQLSKERLIILVTHDEKNAEEIGDVVYLLKDHCFHCLKDVSTKERSKPLEKKLKKDKGMRMEDAVVLQTKYLKKKKWRVILSSLFLSFCLTILYLGFHLYFRMDQSIGDILAKYYASHEYQISMKREISSSGKLHLNKDSLPDEEVLQILQIDQVFPNLSFFLPSENDVVLLQKTSQASFQPVIVENKNNLAMGSGLQNAFDVVVNDCLLEELELDHSLAINKTFDIHHQVVVSDSRLESKDHLSLSFHFTIRGISKEQKAFNRPIVYYSYSKMYEYLSSKTLPHISLEKGKVTTIGDLLSDWSTPQDYLTTSALFLSSQGEKMRKQAKHYYQDTVSISSITLQTKDSIQDIVSMVLMIVLVFMSLNLLTSFMFLFLSIYSLYSDNIRFFALIKVFTRSKRDVHTCAMSMQMIYMVFVSLFTLILSFVFSFVIREIFNYLSFPTFLSLFHVGIYLLVIMGAFLLCFFASVLPLRRIKDKDIQKELEGED